jgi:hypothetical protein
VSIALANRERCFSVKLAESVYLPANEHSILVETLAYAQNGLYLDANLTAHMGDGCEVAAWKMLRILARGAQIPRNG